MTIDDYKKMLQEHKDQRDLITCRIDEHKQRARYNKNTTPDERARNAHDTTILYGMKKDLDFAIKGLTKIIERLERQQNEIDRRNKKNSGSNNKRAAKATDDQTVIV